MATLQQDTVLNVLQIISDLRGESSTNSNANRIRAISRAERDFAKRRLWSFFRLNDQTVAGTGANSYTIGSNTFPMRVKGLAQVFVGGTTEDKRYQLVDQNQYRFLYNQNNSTRMAYEWYDVANDAFKVYINTAPAATDTIYFDYYWQPPKRTTTTDVVVCPNMDIVVRLALAYLYEGEDEEKYAEELQQAEQIINEYEGHDDSPNRNMTVTFGLPSDQVRKGIGTY